MFKRKSRLAVFISGRGSSFANLLRCQKEGILPTEIVLLVSSNERSVGLQHAEGKGIDTLIYPVKYDKDPVAASGELLRQLNQRKVEYIVLAGYLKLLPLELVDEYRDRILNIHPALLPNYGGKGMYGRHVHEAVLKSGDSETGVTVHLVNENYDEGRILEQVKVPLFPADTVDRLAERVLAAEHELYPKVIKKLIEGEYDKSNE